MMVRIVGAANGTATPHDGRLLKSWSSNTEFGILELESTDDPNDAKQYESAVQMFAEWRAVSEVQPTRPTDGKANRPLTALTIEFVKDGES